ncbi:MAG: 30S ribosomal protein S6 [Ardenticatenales bacterium]|jgi:small subunit ribosomal protein S6|nr:30S ribosomal protein S6 [Ardenticatenales bacterium]
MHAYELVMVLQSALDDGGVNALLAGLAGGVERNGGEVQLAGQLMDRRGTVGETTEGWKARRLAYPMSKNKEGYFAVLRFNAPPAYIVELERGLQLDENVLRYITVRGDE